jgi:hypothetical protein
MPWVKIDDQFWANPKVANAGNEAAGIFARSLAYCASQLTDGFVSNDAALFITKGKQKPLDHMVASGLWEVAQGGYRIPDYLDFNPPRVKVEERRRKDAERKAQGRVSERSPNGVRLESVPTPQGIREESA